MNHQDALIARYILPPSAFTPDPAEVRLIGYGVPVWALVGYYKAVGDPARVARDYRVPFDAVEATLAWYEKHRAAIDHRLAMNAA